MKVNNVSLNWNLKELNSFNSNLPYINAFFKQGKLSLILGSGASKAINLPNWQELIDNLLLNCGLSPIPSYSTNLVLKQTADKIKQHLGSENLYLDKITDTLYNSVNFDFNTASKELLIGLSSLLINKKKGRINTVITYNFDSVLEWYLELFGLELDIASPINPIRNESDIVIYHIHGYLPHANMGHERFKIVFSQEEFEDRTYELDQDFWKVNQQNILNSKIFLSIGLSISTIKEDLCPIIRKIDKLNGNININRDAPFGYAFIAKPKPSEIDDNFNQSLNDLFDHAIVPILVDKNDIPKLLLKISSNSNV